MYDYMEDPSMLIQFSEEKHLSLCLLFRHIPQHYNFDLYMLHIL